jgi:hypothetical protein
VSSPTSAEERQDARRSAEDDGGEHDVAERPAAGAALGTQLEVGHRPQDHGHDRDEQEAQSAGDETAEHRGRDAGGGRDGVACQAELAAGGTHDAHGADAPERELGGDGDRQP